MGDRGQVAADHARGAVPEQAVQGWARMGHEAGEVGPDDDVGGVHREHLVGRLTTGQRVLEDGDLGQVDQRTRDAVATRVEPQPDGPPSAARSGDLQDAFDVVVHAQAVQRPGFEPGPPLGIGPDKGTAGGVAPLDSAVGVGPEQASGRVFGQRRPVRPPPPPPLLEDQHCRTHDPHEHPQRHRGRRCDNHSDAGDEEGRGHRTTWTGGPRRLLAGPDGGQVDTQKSVRKSAGFVWPSGAIVDAQRY